jgi:hypothetical protein
MRLVKIAQFHLVIKGIRWIFISAVFKNNWETCEHLDYYLRSDQLLSGNSSEICFIRSRIVLAMRVVHWLLCFATSVFSLETYRKKKDLSAEIYYTSC